MSELVDLINEQIKRKYIEGIFTSLPAKVIAVRDFQDLQVVDVQPVIGVVEEDGVEMVPQPIYNVPVVLMGGGGALISIPLAVGDTVLLMFTMKDISSWQKGDGGYTVADSSRLHNINDAIAITGLYTNKSTLKPDPNDVVIKFKNSEIRVASDDTITIKGDKVIVDHATSLELGSGALEPAVLGNLLKSYNDTHTHPTGVGPSGPPIVPMPDAGVTSVFSTTVTVGT